MATDITLSTGDQAHAIEAIKRTFARRLRCMDTKQWEIYPTLHTDDAPSTITRLLNMGIEPFLVAAALNIVEAQRLIRKICANCKEPIPTPKDDLKALLGAQ